MSEPVKLKYLFTALYEDGTQYVQTPEDTSIFDPEKRSQFYDVLEIGKKKKLIAFILKGEGHEYGVDLRDGHFEVDGMPFRMHEHEVKDLELIFFRQHTHDFLQSKTETKEIRHQIVYRIGWKKRDRQTYQRVMEID